MTGQVALVTGAGSGDRQSPAMLLVERGMITACADISLQSGDKAVAAIFSFSENAQDRPT
jgi:NAD(P)-dependent dehydrogenase (short-subunit alcohol dehydrogenase family)